MLKALIEMWKTLYRFFFIIIIVCMYVLGV